MSEKVAKHHICFFSARLLWALEPFVTHLHETAPERMWNGNIFVEPAPEGGAFVGAVHGHAMAVFHDPGGFCREPVTLDIPALAFEACAPREPIVMPYCGAQYLAEMPEWMQPGDVMATDAGLNVGTRMRHPQWAEEDDEFHPALYTIIASTAGRHDIGMDYRLTPGAPVNWRKALRKAISDATRPAGETHAFNPVIVNLFSRIVDMFARDVPPEEAVRIFHRATGTDAAPGAIIITVEKRPDFVGCYMPQQPGDAQSVSWHFLKKGKADA